MSQSDSKLLAEAAVGYMGTRTERERARLLGKQALAPKRQRSRLLSASTQWQAWELELLVKIPDDEIASRTGRTESAIKHKRSRLGIAQFGARPAWLPEELARLGKVPDGEIVAFRAFHGNFPQTDWSGTGE